MSSTISHPALCPRVHADSQRVSVVICTTSVLAALAWRERPGWEDADRAWVLPYALRPEAGSGGVEVVFGVAAGEHFARVLCTVVLGAECCGMMSGCCYDGVDHCIAWGVRVYL